MAKKESQQDIEKRALFYKIKRWQLGSVVLPILTLIVALVVIMFVGFIIPVLIFPVYSIVLFIVFRKKTKRLKAELLEKGGLNPEKIKEYTKIFNKAWTKQFIIWGIILLVGLLIIFDSQNASSKKSKNNQSEENGFIGSDGKYHEYIPEFGDDVNDWMEENW